MLKLISRLFSYPTRHRTKSFAVPVRVPVRARYDAAQTTEDNRRHWAMADALSAAAANSAGVRRLLRNRARYEVANNSYAKGIVDTLANDVIGYGPTIQIETGDPIANVRIKMAFEKWAKEISLAAKLRTMRRAKAVDGEAFAILTTNSKLRSPIKLDIKLVEADQVTNPRKNDPNNADGITFDADGNPISYAILPEHPGSGMMTTQEPKYVPASSVIHWFNSDRAGQVRGIPEIMPALPLFAQLRRYTLAVIAAAETAADHAAVLYTDAPAAGEADDVDPFLPIEIEQRMMTTVPAGWKLGQFKAEQPASTYAEFKRELLNEISRCVSMPFNIAACNSASYNYSSGQLDHQTYFSAIDVDQDDAELVVLTRVWYAWLEEAALVPGLLTPQPYGDWSDTVSYLWRSRGHADPTKMANASDTRLNNHTATLADEWAALGFNWEDKLRQRAKEIALMKELGLPTSTGSNASELQPTDEENEREQDVARAA